MIPEKLARKYGKVAEFGGRDLGPTGVHLAPHVPTPDEELRLIYTTNDPTNSTLPFAGAFEGDSIEESEEAFAQQRAAGVPIVPEG